MGTLTLGYNVNDRLVTVPDGYIDSMGMMLYNDRVDTMSVRGMQCQVGTLVKWLLCQMDVSIGGYDIIQ